MLLVPSAKRTPLVVLTIMDWGDERVPRESRMATLRPTVAAEDTRTMALWPPLKTDVSTRTTEVLAVIV